MPAKLKSQILCTLGDCIRGNPNNRKAFENLTDSLLVSNRPISSYLSTLIVDSTLSTPLRAAALYTLECYLFENEDGKDETITGLAGNALIFFV